MIAKLPQLLDCTHPPRSAIRAVAAQIRSEWKESEYRRRAQAARILQRRLMQLVQS
jgi:hypothetical protein